MTVAVAVDAANGRHFVALHVEWFDHQLLMAERGLEHRHTPAEVFAVVSFAIVLLLLLPQLVQLSEPWVDILAPETRQHVVVDVAVDAAAAAEKDEVAIRHVDPMHSLLQRLRNNLRHKVVALPRYCAVAVGGDGDATKVDDDDVLDVVVGATPPKKELCDDTRHHLRYTPMHYYPFLLRLQRIHRQPLKAPWKSLMVFQV